MLHRRRLLFALSTASASSSMAAMNTILRSATTTTTTTTTPSSSTTQLPQPSPVIFGDPNRSVRTSSSSLVTCADFVGNSDLSNQRLSGGDLLGLMDVTAARTAMFHVTGQKTKSKSLLLDAAATESDHVSVATVGTDNTSFLAPVLHGDMVEMTGQVIHAGSSSMGIYVQAFRMPFASPGKTLVADSYFSMVAIDRQLKAAKVVPAVQLESEAELARNREYQAIRKAQKDNDAYFKQLEQTVLTPECINSERSSLDKDGKFSHVSISCTETFASRIFFSGHLNLNKTIFGGELLRWMESHATYCGRRFARSKNVYSIGMHSVSFNNPIFITDWVSLRARLALVRDSTMEVDVKLSVERDGCPMMTNRASFVLIHTDEVGTKASIPTGLTVEGESQRVMRHIAMAKYRYEKSKRFHDCQKEMKRKLESEREAREHEMLIEKQKRLQERIRAQEELAKQKKVEPTATSDIF